MTTMKQTAAQFQPNRVKLSDDKSLQSDGSLIIPTTVYIPSVVTNAEAAH